MRLRRIALLSTLALLAFGASQASAVTVWNLDIHHSPTNFVPGSTGDYWLDVTNQGGTGSSGPVTVTFDLPAGLSRNSIQHNFDRAYFEDAKLTWSCPGAPGDTTVTCTTSGSIPRHTVLRNLNLVVDVDPGASGELITSAQISDGGAVKAATAEEPTPISADPAPFGIFAPSFVVDFFEADGLTPVRESGAHPALATFPFDFNSVPAPTSGAERQTTAAETIRGLHVDTPPGFVGAPTAVDECTQAEFTVGQCPASSQVGRFDVRIYPITSGEEQVFSPFTVGVFNMTHPRGVVTDLALVIAGNPVHIKVSLNAANRYAITSEVPNINETVPAFGSRLTLWGVPADKSHDSERCPAFSPPGALPA